MMHKSQIQIYDISDIPDNVMPTRVPNKNALTRDEFFSKFTTFHFTLFDNPSQAWIEAYHGREADRMRDCQYIPQEAVDISSPRIDFFSEIFDKLKQYSKLLVL